MLGMFHLLPFLKGWSYKWHKIERAEVLRGADPIDYRVEERGWFMNMDLLTTDAYGTLSLKWQDPELKTTDFDFYPELYNSLGAFAQDPSGWCQKYYRPNPTSTAGIYYVVPFSGSGHGAVWPYVPTNIMSIHLPKDSNQSSAYIMGRAFVIAITSPKDFIQSLRRLLNPNASLNIDDALLAVGPATFKEAQS